MPRFLEPASAATKARTAAGSVTAKSTESKVVSADTEGQRIGLYVVNQGANPVWLALGATAEPDKGIFLAKEGGSAQIDNYTGVVSVITKTGESLVTFSEV